MISYLDRTADSDGNVTESIKTCEGFTLVQADMTTDWTDGWYVVWNSVVIPSRIEVSGTVNIIICDEETLTLPQGIHVTGANCLNIYGQADETGKLIATGLDYAAIGGNYREAGGIITINSGTVVANGSSNRRCPRQ